MKYQILTAALLLFLGVSSPSIGYARGSSEESLTQYSEVQLAQPRYENVVSCSSQIAISGNTVTVKGKVNCKRTSTIAITMRLQKKSGMDWETVESWVKTSTGNSMSYKDTCHVRDRGTYRLYSSFNVDGENVSCISDEKTY
ncbi:MAG: hypothetical protein RR139_02185 [Lachnospiraceae bacterium]